MTRDLGRNYDYVGVTSHALDAAIAVVAAKQRGNIARWQLLDIGLDDKAIAYRVKIGRLHRVFRGVYSVGRPPGSPQDWASAAVLACGLGAALSHGSAMALWGYWRHWERPYEVTVVGDRRTKGVTVHRSTTLRRHDVTRQLGVRVTTPARTIFDISPRQTDKAFKRTVNSALHSLWLTEGHLEDAVARHPNLPGARRAAKLIGLPGTPTRSGWEDDFPAFCKRYGLPIPVMGAPLHGYIVDALFVRERVIVELDSWRFHQGKPAFETDRERDAVTLSHGYVTLRVTEERLEERPRQEAERLHAILAAHAPRAA
ncbi:MAG TPA: type IV toxin-antitoxin system AbiEi family antitoxin domain-containing protein [Solirubrobacteraceae bacterium]|nr:type IV toxin-antitoxin system AbiEi family antitoxin domain-containing protein [Solirubrobacteraceae bacterium]